MQLLRLTGKLLSWPWKSVAHHATFFVFMFALGFLCTQLELPRYAKNPQPYELSAEELFVDLLVLCVLLSIFPTCVARWLKRLLYVVFYAVAIVDVFCYQFLESTLSPTMILLIGETNGGEASEFLSAYVTPAVLQPPLGWVLLLLLLHVAWTLLCRKGYVQRVRERLLPLFRRVPRVQVDWLLGLLVLGALAAVWSPVVSNKKAIMRLFSCDNLGQVEKEMNRTDHAVLYLPVYRLAFCIQANRLASHLLITLDEVARHARIDSCTYRTPHIVFIIGESYNRHHSQLYGYEKPTTPLQVELERAGRLVRFTDVVSPWNITSFVFKNVFSMHAIGDDDTWADQPLFPQLFRLAGYRVNFVTNQFLPQAKEAVYDFSGGFFMNQPELSQLMFDSRNSSLHPLDDGVLADWDKCRKATDVPQLSILHLKGQHMLYRLRYAKGRKKLTYKDYEHRKLGKRDRMVLADYDNSIIYNDSIVAQVTSRMEEEEAVVIYMPDHGEECFGFDLSVMGRNHTDNITWQVAHEEYEIPFWIWYSARYANNHPEVVAAIWKAKDLPFMTDNLPHILLWLAGISAPYYRTDRNLLSPDYDAKRPRLLKGIVDYNTIKQ